MLRPRPSVDDKALEAPYRRAYPRTQLFPRPMPAASSGVRRPWSVAATAHLRGCAPRGRRPHPLSAGSRSVDGVPFRGPITVSLTDRIPTVLRVVRVVRGTIDTYVPQEQTMSVRWIVRVLRAIPLTPWWLEARRQRNRREMREHLRRYYAQGQ